jgi:hypothetical protein
LADEAWIAATNERKAIQDAIDAIEHGKGKAEFERELANDLDPSDARAFADKVAAAGRAWAEAMKQVAEKYNEATETSKNKAELERLIKEAKDAIGRGRSLAQFQTEQAWLKPKD